MQLRQLGGDPKVVEGLRARDRENQTPGRPWLDVDDGDVRLPVKTHRTSTAAHPPIVVVYWRERHHVARAQSWVRFGLDVLGTLLGMLSPESSLANFVTPLIVYTPICPDQVMQMKLLKELPTLDDISFTVRQMGHES
jgi:hypothetical protein